MTVAIRRCAIVDPLPSTVTIRIFCWRQEWFLAWPDEVCKHQFKLTRKCCWNYSLVVKMLKLIAKISKTHLHKDVNAYVMFKPKDVLVRYHQKFQLQLWSSSASATF